jgi:hypothetical protein
MNSLIYYQKIFNVNNALIYTFFKIIYVSLATYQIVFNMKVLQNAVNVKESFI